MKVDDPTKYIQGSSELLHSEQINHEANPGTLEFRRTSNDRIFILTIHKDTVHFGVYFLPESTALQDVLIKYQEYAELDNI